ncbi:MAG: FtsX-like permease family protein [Oscillospiraceae bacterium]|nr:FtsX-like permease family protein [Oscillospiraceae bacterium]
MLSLGRGYEIGVLRALGMGKGRAWVRLLIENILLMSSALVFSLCAMLIFHKHFAFSLLSIDAETEQILIETFSTDNMFRFNWQAFLYTLWAAFTVTLISSALSNVLISNSAPLKLIQKHK